MPAPLITVGAVILVLAVLRSRPGTQLGIVGGVLLLVPDTLLVPALPTRYPFSLLSIHRLVLLALIVGLGVGVVSGRIPTSTLRLTRTHLAAFAFLVVAIVNGVALGQAAVPAQSAVASFLLVLAQFAFFTAALVALRATEDRWRVLTVFAVLTTMTAAIAVAERAFGWNYVDWFFSDLPEQSDRIIGELRERGGSPRSRSSFQFALAYAWIGTMLLPLLLVVAVRWRRLFSAAALALLGTALVFTVTRSIAVGLPVALVVLVLASRDRRIRAAGVAVAVVGLIAVVAIPGIRVEETEETRASVELREERLEVVAAAAAERPFVGIGLGGLQTIGGKGTDSTAPIVYLETGAIGLAAFALLLLTVLAEAVAAVVFARGSQRALAAAGCAGVFAGVVGAFAMHLFAVPAAAFVFWFLHAVALAGPSVDEPPSGPLRDLVSGVSLPRLAGVAGAVLVALSVAAVAPDRSTVRIRFETITGSDLSRATAPLFFLGRIHVNGVCEVARHVGDTRADIDVTCHHLDGAPGGIGEIRVEAADARTAGQEMHHIVTSGREVSPMGFQPRTMGPAAEGPRSLLRTAPAWVLVLSLGGALLMPRPRIRGAIRQVE